MESDVQIELQQGRIEVVRLRQGITLAVCDHDEDPNEEHQQCVYSRWIGNKNDKPFLEKTCNLEEEPMD